MFCETTMLDSVKDVLTKEVDVKGILTHEVDVKGILTKEVNVKEFLEMEIELTKLKEVLATEIKLKEFLVQEIDLGKLLSKESSEKAEYSEQEDALENHVEESIDEQNTNMVVAEDPIKRDLPAYDFSLIDTLHDEHKSIRLIFNKIMSFAIEKDYEKVAGQLEIFNSEIRKHYQRADIELYSYLKTYVQIKYPKREKAFTQLSLEMKNLSIEIYYIISQSPNIPLTEKTYNGFMKEFMSVGKLLNERILREESVLFKMYQQTNAAKDIS